MTLNLLPLSPRSDPDSKLASLLQLVLHLPRSRTVCGARAFSIAAPTVWNKLQLMFNFRKVVSFVLNRVLKQFFSNCLQLLGHRASASVFCKGLYGAI